MRKMTTLAFAGLLTISSYSCANHDLGEPIIEYSCDEHEAVSFSVEIKEILVNHCAVDGCHDGSMGASLDWTNDETFQSHATEARRRVLLPLVDDDHMPHNSRVDLQLTFEQIQLIACWVDQGASISN